MHDCGVRQWRRGQWPTHPLASDAAAGRCAARSPGGCAAANGRDQRPLRRLRGWFLVSELCRNGGLFKKLFVLSRMFYSRKPSDMITGPKLSSLLRRS